MKSNQSKNVYRNFGNANDWLRYELEKRQRVNPQFSGRAFARLLKISPGRLSEYLNNKRALTQNIAEKITSRLGFSLTNQKEIMNLSRVGKTHKAKENRFSELEVEAFEVIGNWYHYGILNLLQTDGCQFTAKYMSRRLGIAVHQAKSALDRLKSLGLIIL